MTTYTSIHRIKGISANAGETAGSPFSIVTYSEDGARTEITLFTDSLPLSRRLADAINEAMKPVSDEGRFLLVAEIVDALEAENCPLGEARMVLRAALDKYENRLEAAYQRQQDGLAESGGSDDSAYRRDMTNAGRGHLSP